MHLYCALTQVYLKNSKPILAMLEQSRINGVLAWCCPIARGASKV